MIRYRLEHDRDKQVIGDNHWNLYELDTDDPKVPRRCVAWGSHAACLAFAIGVIELRHRTGVMPR